MTLKDALENLNTRKDTSKRNISGILSKHSEIMILGQNLSSKLFSAWSSRSIRFTRISM